MLVGHAPCARCEKLLALQLPIRIGLYICWGQTGPTKNEVGGVPYSQVVACAVAQACADCWCLLVLVVVWMVCDPPSFPASHHPGVFYLVQHLVAAASNN